MADPLTNVLVASCGLVHLATAQAQQLPSDWLIVPGERVGPITATTSEAMLETIFGAGNVESVDVYLGEGFTEPGAAVFSSGHPAMQALNPGVYQMIVFLAQ